MIQYGESKVEIEKTKICLHFIIAYDILIVLVIANSVISILYTAITNAIDYCIEENIMREFLIKHKAEVFSVCITEFDEKIYEAELREEAREEGRTLGLEEGRTLGREEGRNLGREEGRILERIEMYKEDNYSDMDIMKKLILRFDITLQEAQEYLDKYYKETDKSNS